MLMRTLVAVLLLGAVGWGQGPPLTTEKACRKDGGIWTDYGDGHTLCTTTTDVLDKVTEKWVSITRKCIADNRKLTASLNHTTDVMNQAAELIKQCEVEIQKPRLPLTVNPGECYRIGGDMSMHLIECP